MNCIRFDRKTQSVVLVLSALLLLLATPALAASVLDHDLPLIQSQDFESAALGELPSGWEWVINEKTSDKPMVGLTPFDLVGTSGKQSLFLTRTAGAQNVTSHAVFNFAPAKERIVISFKLYSSNANRALRMLMSGSKNPYDQVQFIRARPAVYLSFGANIMPLKDAAKNTWHQQIPYTFGAWHQIVLDIDITANKFDIYLDDLQTPATSAAIPFYEPYTDLTSLGLTYQSTSNTNNTAPAYVDDLMIWGR